MQNTIKKEISGLLRFHGQEIDKILTSQSVNKGEFILKEGNSAFIAFYLIRGITRNFIYKNGKEITLQFNFKEEMVFPLNSFNKNLRSDEYIEALTDIDIVKVKLNEFEDLKESNPELFKLELKINELYTFQLAKRLRDFQTLTAKERYLELIKTEPLIIQYCKLTHIASYLGLNLGSLSRIRNSL